MTTPRKPGATRVKEFELAIFRIERGRSHTKAKKLSIAAVAREVGVTPALIHNQYPTVTDSNIASYERSLKELPSAELSITLPIVGPSSFRVETNINNRA